MSSIYRKGRDGYYYYQTYLYNPESKKKDKRIFHSLSTKNLADAEKQKKELDIKYEKRRNTYFSLPMYFNRANLKSIKIIFLGIFLIIILVLSFFWNAKTEPKKVNHLIREYSLAEKSKIETLPEIKNPKIETLPEIENPKIDTLPEIENVKIVDSKLGSNQETSIPIIPKYKIQRVEEISGLFKQGKLFVTIEKSISKEGQLLICNYLTTQYVEFSNIIICLYSNTPHGVELAKGSMTNTTVDDQKKSWLVMFTYNPVEGKYFDDNPNGYLGIY